MRRVNPVQHGPQHDAGTEQNDYIRDARPAGKAIRANARTSSAAEQAEKICEGESHVNRANDGANVN